ncbi:hypothetical protein NPIL_230541 [Nephila pilipes]|uniref:Uncharacterized protein n=1 Tax=Nephila pilipes TaxID=299642 RepID=A0A8X6U043_NEPPI|nr:hypothetical protein NPIL_230541 [Nephila pilipes]
MNSGDRDIPLKRSPSTHDEGVKRYARAPLPPGSVACVLWCPATLATTHLLREDTVKKGRGPGFYTHSEILERKMERVLLFLCGELANFLVILCWCVTDTGKTVNAELWFPELSFLSSFGLAGVDCFL